MTLRIPQLNPFQWPSPPSRIDLDSQDVHVWLLYLPSYRKAVSLLYSFLAPDELEKVQRLRIDSLRERAAVTRGCARLILSLYTDQSPRAVRFSYNKYGKPALTESSVSFNISHSGDLAIVAIADKRDIGIDIEHMKTRSNYLAIAERFFSPSEYQWLQALPHAKQLRAFYSCWTQKEAFIKATGQGLFMALDQFEITPHSSGPAPLRSVAWDRDEHHHWTLIPLAPWPGYAAACAIKGQSASLACWYGDDYLLKKLRSNGLSGDLLANLGKNR